jgi:hypothetical protein
MLSQGIALFGFRRARGDYGQSHAFGRCWVLGSGESVAISVLLYSADRAFGPRSDRVSGGDHILHNTKTQKLSYKILANHRE